MTTHIGLNEEKGLWNPGVHVTNITNNQYVYIWIWIINMEDGICLQRSTHLQINIIIIDFKRT